MAMNGQSLSNLVDLSDNFFSVKAGLFSCIPIFVTNGYTLSKWIHRLKCKTQPSLHLKWKQNVWQMTNQVIDLEKQCSLRIELVYAQLYHMYFDPVSGILWRGQHFGVHFNIWYIHRVVFAARNWIEYENWLSCQL